MLFTEFQYIPCYGLSEGGVKTGFDQLEFQYIPCYGLSQERGLFLIISANFNTSHVTVYPGNIQIPTGGTVFQYIPCYGLS